jgi:CheY-like chemotaxis protein
MIAAVGANRGRVGPHGRRVVPLQETEWRPSIDSCPFALRLLKASLGSLIQAGAMKLLIVDDNATIRHLLRRVVGKFCVEIVECEDGDEAAEAYKRDRPDVVLMDLKMARVDGLTATRRILALDPRARVVIVSEYDDRAMRDAARNSGACGYAGKHDLSVLPGLILLLARAGDSES